MPEPPLKLGTRTVACRRTRTAKSGFRFFAFVAASLVRHLSFEVVCTFDLNLLLKSGDPFLALSFPASDEAFAFRP
jgi:hypothetical protein